ncbi:SCO2583 family membrane protein [Streptomyces chrestomyceticus]|uniref:SCO2583 family membrane protein n=1 Tax=Streptomyces chrestomyceticus TaxID=68185 RepID=UPI00379ED202
MAGAGDPPEGTPEGAAGGGEDEYRSVVFDESFVRAARLQEYSARERMEDHARAVRTRHAWARLGGARQAVLLALLILIAFGTAIYMGVRHPYRPPEPMAAEPLRSTVVPLAPEGAVPGGKPADLFARSPAAQYRIGAAGVNLPAVSRTEHFSDGQVVSALTLAKNYLVRSSIDPATLTGGSVRPVGLLLDPGQLDQFDRSLAHPADDGRHAATGWLTRFDPDEVELADTDVRVTGTLSATEVGADALEVSADFTFAYAVRPAGAGAAGAGAGARAGAGTRAGAKATAGQRAPAASLFTVRRELRFRISRDDLDDHRLEVLQSSLQAGPMSCSADASGTLRPLLAGQRAGDAGPAATDPYARGRSNTGLCGKLAATSQPGPARPDR